STLTVVAAHLLSIAVSPATPSIAVGTTQQFSAVGTFDDGSTQLLTSVTWSSSAASVASVSSSGLATAVGTGSTTITASSGGVTGSASLTVSAATLVSVDGFDRAPDVDHDQSGKSKNCEGHIAEVHRYGDFQ